MPAMGARTTGGETSTAPSRSISGSAARESLDQVGLDLVERDALLRHRVALANGDRVIVESLEVDSDAERRADLVLSAVTTADRTGVVEVDVPPVAQLSSEVTRLRREV